VKELRKYINFVSEKLIKYIDKVITSEFTNQEHTLPLWDIFPPLRYTLLINMYETHLRNNIIITK